MPNAAILRVSDKANFYKSYEQTASKREDEKKRNSRRRFWAANNTTFRNYGNQSDGQKNQYRDNSS